ncbi:PREDICTED: MLP-like protein 423 isoform X3 [Lupinus angustifolius]|uniref:MLP-like protein 423 isoform X3 n=1 Tax=Lupinus angustifolius TaxID=3871 RepID=UPI00092F3932|nr:PREDICTED: MLP-like protein 423 isoform X3 [Lupinus angustifolius]
MPIRGKLEGGFEAKSSADKLWGALRDWDTIFPKAFPDAYKAVDIVEGDGKAVGSVFRVSITGDSPFAKSIREKIEAVDDVKRTLILDVAGIDGNVFHIYKKYVLHVSVTPKGDGSVVKVAVEYENPTVKDPEPTEFIDVEVQGFQDLDAYLQNK